MKTSIEIEIGSALVTPWTGMCGAQDFHIESAQRFRGEQEIPRGRCGTDEGAIVADVSHRYGRKFDLRGFW